MTPRWAGLVALGLSLLAGPAMAEILRCEAQRKATNHLTELRIDIVLPKKSEYDKLLALVDSRDGELKRVIGDVLEPKALGLIEIRTRLSLLDERGSAGKFSKPERHTLVVTRAPDAEHGNSLIGLFFDGGRPVLIRADVWAEGRPMWIADSSGVGFDLYRGNCAGD